MRKASVVLLTALVVVLGLVAFAPRPPEPTVVGVTMTHQPESPPRDFLVRVWSDGLTEENTRRRLPGDSGVWSGWVVVPE